MSDTVESSLPGMLPQPQQPTDETQASDAGNTSNADPTAILSLQPSPEVQVSSEQEPMQASATDAAQAETVLDSSIDSHNAVAAAARLPSASAEAAQLSQSASSSSSSISSSSTDATVSPAADTEVAPDTSSPDPTVLLTSQPSTEAQPPPQNQPEPDSDAALPETAVDGPVDSSPGGISTSSPLLSASTDAEQLDAASSFPTAPIASPAAESALAAATSPESAEQSVQPEVAASLPAQPEAQDGTESAAGQQLSKPDVEEEMKEQAVVADPTEDAAQDQPQLQREEESKQEAEAADASAAAATMAAEPTEEERRELLDALASVPLSPQLAEAEIGTATAAAASTDTELSASSPTSSSSSAPPSEAADSQSETVSLSLTATIPAPAPPPAPAPLPREAMIHVRIPLSSTEAAASSGSPAASSVLVPVLISREYLSYRRPFLGGWRHHRTAIVKLNAETQTERRRTAAAGARREERETQTGEVVTRSVQTWREAGTQMERRDLYLGQQGEEAGERVLQARDWVPSEVLESEREDAARRLQCWLRVCFSMRRMLQLKAERQQAEQETAAQQAAVAAQREAEQQQQVHRRLHPTSASDFRLLYAELRAWREHESSRISSQQSASAAEKQQQLSVLLSKEVKLLQTIDRLKIIAAQRRQAAGISRRLDMMSSPHEWTTSSGERLEVVTPLTLRSQQLISLYTALSLPSLAWEQRLDALIHCRLLVCELRHLPMSAELLQLIDREQEWYGRRHASARWQETAALAGLRRRLSVLFLSFIQHPEANPAAELYSQTLSREHRQRLLQHLDKPLPERETKGKAGQGEGERELIGRAQQ